MERFRERVYVRKRRMIDTIDDAVTNGSKE